MILNESILLKQIASQIPRWNIPQNPSIHGFYIGKHASEKLFRKPLDEKMKAPTGQRLWEFGNESVICLQKKKRVRAHQPTLQRAEASGYTSLGDLHESGIHESFIYLCNYMSPPHRRKGLECREQTAVWREVKFTVGADFSNETCRGLKNPKLYTPNA